MEILVNRKTIRKSRRGLAPLRYEIEGAPRTLRELLLAMVKEEVTRFNAAKEGEGLLAWLSQEELENRAREGKVSFAGQAGKAADLGTAEQVMLNAFADGLFRVLVDGEEITDLAAPLTLTEDSVVTIIRLSFLAGQLW
ncbi:MAG: hypothetical protein IJM69_00855 [Firmicutes bacterium]|nr:hypothetical protein [Bacillota bacterium]